MTLTIRLKKRWITSVLREAGKSRPPLPWQRGSRSRPLALRDSDHTRRLSVVQS